MYDSECETDKRARASRSLGLRVNGVPRGPTGRIVTPAPWPSSWRLRPDPGEFGLSDDVLITLGGPLIRDRLIEEMRKRPQPICVSCLCGAMNTDFLAVLEASRDDRCALVFDRKHGICPECRCQQQLVFQRR